MSLQFADRMTVTLLGLLFSATTAPVVAQPSLVQRSLDLSVALIPAESSLDSEATLTLENIGDLDTNEIFLQLNRGFVVRGVSIEGASTTWHSNLERYIDWPEFEVLQLTIETPEPIAPGASIRVSVEYGGELLDYVDSGMRYVQDHVSPDFTLIRSDALAFPSLGRPSLESLRAQPLVDFSARARVTVPDPDLLVAGPVPGIRQPVPGGWEWHFEVTDSIPFLLLAAGRFETLETGDAIIHHFPEDGQGAQALAEAVATANEAYTGWFGRHHADRQITIVEIPEGWGSQASLTGGIIQTADAFRAGDQVGQLYHEIAHLWHPRELEAPADRWNEGFATFLQGRLDSQQGGPPLETFIEGIATRIAAWDAAAEIPLVGMGEAGATDFAYLAGTLFFYHLYRVMGEDSFDRCVASFLGRHRSQGADNHDLRTSLLGCDDRAHRPIRDWFDQARGIQRLRNGEAIAQIITPA